MKARPTTYKGIAMRSRLEARYAAMLDVAFPGRWAYEPRAFANERGQYLPDFVLRGNKNIYIEVKPTIEAAMLAFERMEIIWSSEPEAALWVEVYPLGVFQAGSHLRRWRWHLWPAA